jgi:hypothetical protein
MSPKVAERHRLKSVARTAKALSNSAQQGFALPLVLGVPEATALPVALQRGLSTPETL